MVGLQELFDHLEWITNRVSILFHQRQLSPLLVDRNEMIREMRALKGEQREMDNVLMIATGDVWPIVLPRMSLLVLEEEEQELQHNGVVGKLLSLQILKEGGF